MFGTKNQNEKAFPLVDEVTPDLEGFLDAGQDPDCEERIFTVHGTEVTEYGVSE